MVKPKHLILNLMTLRSRQLGDAVDRSNSPNESVGDDKGGLHEEGGYYGKNANGNEVVIDSAPGEGYEKGEAGAGVNPLKTADSYSSKSDWRKQDKIGGTFHVHPIGDNTVKFVQSPSGADLRNSGTRFDNGIKGNNYILGAGNNSVTVYKNGSVLATFPLNKFINIK
jgi:hypothetical protein